MVFIDFYVLVLAIVSLTEWFCFMDGPEYLPVQSAAGVINFPLEGPQT